MMAVRIVRRVLIPDRSGIFALLLTTSD